MQLTRLWMAAWPPLNAPATMEELLMVLQSPGPLWALLMWLSVLLASLGLVSLEKCGLKPSRLGPAPTTTAGISLKSLVTSTCLHLLQKILQEGRD